MTTRWNIAAVTVAVFYVGAPCWAQQTSLTIEITDGDFTPEDVVGNFQFFAIDGDASETRPYEASVIVGSNTFECRESPQNCDGGEHTVTETDIETIYGCDDDVDNDGDGLVDHSDPDCSGPQGWSVSIVAEGCVAIDAATTRGTVADLSIRPPGIRDLDGSFEKTEIVNPDLNDGRRGVVTALVLSFTHPISLPPVSRTPVLRLIGTVGDPCNDAPFGCALRALPVGDGLQGSGERLTAVVTVSGESDAPDVGGVIFTSADCPISEICHNSVDDDGDFDSDCDDSDCRLFPPCIRMDEDCSNGVDDDRDGAVDCADPDCRGRGPCAPAEQICDDGIDNDQDGRADCADPDCDISGLCVEICDDGIDNDGDEQVDCADSSCSAEEICREVCNDGIDNDQDGRTDCVDSDCDLDVHCEEICDDGIDNDQDGRVDCFDGACSAAAECTEICDDGIDNDGDGFVDCRDPECSADVSCREICDDGIDNDQDGQTDCQDLECSDAVNCVEICDDGIDNDGDGRIDCRDLDCRDAVICIEICNDGIDNDGDQRIDCADSECIHAVECTEICDDEIDNDNDGQLDCADQSCAGSGPCAQIQLDADLSFRIELVATPRHGCAAGQFDSPPDDTIPVVAGVYLSSFTPECVGNPDCDGGERVSRFPERTHFGCDDGVDSDGDGLIDLADPDCFGVQGWALSVAVDQCFGLWHATTRGTVGGLDNCPGGLRSSTGGSFEKTELSRNLNRFGAISAVVLSFTEPVTLPPISDSLILLLGGRRERGEEFEQPCQLRVLDPTELGLRGSGEPINTGATTGGETNGLSSGDPIDVGGTTGLPMSDLFLRGDANNDRKVDLADTVWLVNELFRLGPPSPCQNASDVNADELLDTSDALYLISYGFVDGPPPPPPFPACETRSTSSILECSASRACE